VVVDWRLQLLVPLGGNSQNLGMIYIHLVARCVASIVSLLPIEGSFHPLEKLDGHRENVVRPSH